MQYIKCITDITTEILWLHIFENQRDGMSFKR